MAKFKVVLNAFLERTNVSVEADAVDNNRPELLTFTKQVDSDGFVSVITVASFTHWLYWERTDG